MAKGTRALGGGTRSEETRIEQMPLAELRPAATNDKVYKPVDPTDPEVRVLAESIRVQGLLEPIVVTADGVILSGHRRATACRLAGLTVVPVRRESLRSTDPEFLPRLVAFNCQRTKTAAEAVREATVLANPEEPYRALIAARHLSQVHLPAEIELRGEKRRAAITAAKEPFLYAIIGVITRLRRFWPLSDRQVHYNLLNDPPLTHASKPGSRYHNDHKSYKSLVELLTRARIAGRVPFAAIHDPTRPVVSWDVHHSVAPFVQRELNGLLKGYCRDLLQSQPRHVVVLGEKNTVAPIIRPVAADYSVGYMIGRGYSSLPPRHDLAQRFRRSGKDELVVLVLSDFDPEGEDIGHSFAQSLRDDFGLDRVRAMKVGLTAEQVAELALPRGLEAKAGSSRRGRFVATHGEAVYELEAVPPERLQHYLRAALESVLDMDLFRREQEAERDDAHELEVTRRRVLASMGDEIGS